MQVINVNGKPSTEIGTLLVGMPFAYHRQGKPVGDGKGLPGVVTAINHQQGMIDGWVYPASNAPGKHVKNIMHISDRRLQENLQAAARNGGWSHSDYGHEIQVLFKTVADLVSRSGMARQAEGRN